MEPGFVIRPEDLVADSSLLAAYFLESDSFHQSAQEFIAQFDNGHYRLHVPMLVLVETIAAIRRRLGPNWQAKVNEALAAVYEWERQGRLILYPLDRRAMEGALRISQRFGFKGADSVIAALAEDLGYSLKTFDNEILNRFWRAV